MRLLLSIVAIAAAFITVSPAFADGPPGLKVGEKAPQFELTDQSGDKTSLQAMLQDGPVALVFYRSADW